LKRGEREGKVQSARKRERGGISTPPPVPPWGKKETNLSLIRLWIVKGGRRKHWTAEKKKKEETTWRAEGF